MALDKAALKTAIKTAFTDAVGTDDNFDTVAQNIANAIDTFVKSGTVSTIVTTPDTINGTGSGAVT